jgi:hypothetical protein
MFYAGNGYGTFDPAVSLGTGWGGRELVMAGDLTGDGNPDLLARDAKTGTLKAGVKTSCNWAEYDSVAGVGDFNGDGHADWLARRQSDGALYLYKGNGTGSSSARVQIGTGWNAMNAIA